MCHGVEKCETQPILLLDMHNIKCIHASNVLHELRV